MLGKCPNCGKKFEIQPDWIGKASECPYCHEQIIVEVDSPQDNAAAQAAGIGERFLALLIDGLILGAINLVIGVIFGILIGACKINCVTVIINILAPILECCIAMAYEAYFLSNTGATPGKKIFHIKVLYNGENPSIGRSIGRYWARTLSGCICWIGFIMAFFNPEHKALHDTLCDTIVIKE